MFNDEYNCKQYAIQTPVKCIFTVVINCKLENMQLNVAYVFYNNDFIEWKKWD